MKNDNVSFYQEIEKLTEDNNFLAEEVKYFVFSYKKIFFYLFL